MRTLTFSFSGESVATPLWAKCEDETHTPKSGKMESSGTPKNSELHCRDQISFHLSVLSLIKKVFKFRCPKWPCMSHLNIYSPSYGQKKGWEPNWQFDSRPLKVGNWPLPEIFRTSVTWHWKALEESYNFGLDIPPSKVGPGRYELPKSRESNSGQFGDSSLGVSGKRTIWM